MFGEVILKKQMIYKRVAKTGVRGIVVCSEVMGGGGVADPVSLTNLRKIHALLI